MSCIIFQYGCGKGTSMMFVKFISPLLSPPCCTMMHFSVTEWLNGTFGFVMHFVHKEESGEGKRGAHPSGPPFAKYAPHFGKSRKPRTRAGRRQAKRGGRPAPPIAS